ncbi:MAG: CDGSH iron-sulfur domain-containing protein [Gemmatimonadaceae bacterium]
MPHVTITIRNNGPYRVELAEGAEVALVDHEGKPVAMPGPKFSLCRCGASSKKPFCDGTHSKIGFQGAAAAAQAYDAAGGATGGAATGVASGVAGGSTAGAPGVTAPAGGATPPTGDATPTTGGTAAP